jgi:hypothetical protein
MENQPNQPKPSNQMSKSAAWIVLIVIILGLAIGGYFLLKNSNSVTNNINTAANTNQANNTNTTANINSNSASNANSNVDTSNWKTYTNTKYGYTIKVPQSWGRIGESDGSLDTNLNKQSTQETATLSLGPADVMGSELFVQIDTNKTIDQFLKEDTYTTGTGTEKFILDSSNFTTASGINGKKVDLVSSMTGSDFAYVFPNGNNLIDLRFLKENNDALAVINSLKLIN